METAMPSSSNCIFCEISTSARVIDQTENCFVIKDSFPVTDGHTLLIPKRHVADYFELTDTEVSEIHGLLHIHKQLIQENDRSVTGYNIGINVGEAAGQTVFHVHVHLIPRRNGDVENPKGGVRGVIPSKQRY